MTTLIQEPLFPIGDIIVVDQQPAATIQERFEQFHADNPWVADAIAAIARDMLANGCRKVGVGLCFEVLRWQYERRTHGDRFRLNNSYRSRYARLLGEREPDLAGVFETRRLHAE